MWWPLYREGEVAYIRNGYLPFDQLPSPFNINDIYSASSIRETVDDGGERVSEWSTSITELGKWLEQLKQAIR
jgi:hypothetical protein